MTRRKTLLSLAGSGDDGTTGLLGGGRAAKDAVCTRRKRQSPGAAFSIIALVFATPYTAMKLPKRGPCDWPNSTS